MIPSSDIEVSVRIPEDASFWMPTAAEYASQAESGDEGFGFFQDTWMLLELSTEEAAQVVAEERELLGLIDKYSRTAEEFEETVLAVEHPDLPESVPARLRGTELWESAVDPTGSSKEPTFFGLELGVAGLSFALNSLGFIPVASCRAHYGRSWSSSPVVFFATTPLGAEWLQPLLAEAGCGFGIDRERPDFLLIEAPSVAQAIVLAEAITRESSTAPTIILREEPEDN